MLVLGCFVVVDMLVNFFFRLVCGFFMCVCLFLVGR